jgi:hypothetical protein
MTNMTVNTTLQKATYIAGPHLTCIHDVDFMEAKLKLGNGLVTTS